MFFRASSMALTIVAGTGFARLKSSAVHSGLSSSIRNGCGFGFFGIAALFLKMRAEKADHPHLPNRPLAALCFVWFSLISLQDTRRMRRQALHPYRCQHR